MTSQPRSSRAPERPSLRHCTAADAEAIVEVVNAAAARYHGVIPEDRWRDPYMPLDELRAEMAGGVAFTAAEVRGQIVAVMGLQSMGAVNLICHAYVLPAFQGMGIGGHLLRELAPDGREGHVLIGTWRAADWAIDFYRRHGFATVPWDATAELLRTFWSVPDRQIDTSVVLARPALDAPAIASMLTYAASGRKKGH